MRVCLLGAECTGKTTLAHALAQALDAVRVDEALRDWVNQHGRAPGVHEQAALLRAQIARENDGARHAQHTGKVGIVCDTAPLMTAVYSIHYFGDHSLLPEALAHHRGYTHTLLLEPDLPWLADAAQRDGPAAREAVHQQLRALLADAGIAYTRIHGSPAQRLQHARGCLA